MRSIIYDFGDGSRNYTALTYGISADNCIYWVSPSGETSVKYNTSVPSWDPGYSGRQSGNCYYGLAVGLTGGAYTSLGCITSGSTVYNSSGYTWSGSLDSTIEYGFSIGGNTDEAVSCNIGNIYLTVDGTAYTLEQCIQNNYIKPLVLLSRDLWDHGSKNNPLQTLFQGGWSDSSGSSGYSMDLTWNIIFMTNKGHSITKYSMSVVMASERTNLKIWNLATGGLFCLGFKERGIYLGDKALSGIYLGDKEISSLWLKEKDIWGGKEPPAPPTPFQYDYELSGDYDEVDILYTTDLHAAWKPCSRTYGPGQMFTWDNFTGYREKLEAAGIPTFCTDSGDLTVGGSTDATDVANYNTEISKFNNIGTSGYTKYLSVTYGNHEWKFGSSSTSLSYMNQVNNMTACNFADSSGNLIYKPYRAIKIGDYKIGIIGIGYPSANGGGTYSDGIWTYDGYQFYDAINDQASQEAKTAYNSKLYVEVQKYVDLFKENNFDFILVNTHMDNHRDEAFSADTRFKARAEFLLMNTKGIDVVIPGHLNKQAAVLTTTDRDGRSCFVAPTAGAGLNSFGRLKLNLKTKTIGYKLLTQLSDLEDIS